MGRYSDKCQFAHGLAELRSLSRHPKYKSELCRTLYTTGFCPYGTRCHFIHNPEEGRVPGLACTREPAWARPPPDWCSTVPCCRRPLALTWSWSWPGLWAWGWAREGEEVAAAAATAPAAPAGTRPSMAGRSPSADSPTRSAPSRAGSCPSSVGCRTEGAEGGGLLANHAGQAELSWSQWLQVCSRPASPGPPQIAPHREGTGMAQQQLDSARSAGDPGPTPTMDETQDCTHNSITVAETVFCL
ncbi:mRNA decay activator protein ZFP36-like [Leucoraja erinacea]|uniref:mRNA decay activator protein ZFP36-like n=1 Tax=Leucoraja erinaceus TaxID=7782 RepID=UPI00245678CD|nr:mRNA decay activator protein ZFP36-like [Leucoraja erinacea]